MDKFLGWLVVVAILAIAFTAGFWMKQVTGLSVDEMGKQDWLDMADFMTNMLTPLLAFLSLCVLAWTLKTQNQQIHEAKHANSIASLIAHIERLEVEILKVLKETEIEGFDPVMQRHKWGNAYEALVSKSVSPVGIVNKSTLLVFGREKLQRDKLIEVSKKIMILKEVIEEYEALTKDDKRRLSLHATLDGLQKELLRHGYLSDGISGNKGGIVGKFS